MLINLDLSELGISWIDSGAYSDFTFQWYEDVGRIIVQTMVINVVFPVIEFFIFYGMRAFFRLKADNPFLQRCSKPKKRSLKEHVDLYAGPDYAIHYKYSFIINIVFITFMFGAGLPILFPLALCALTVLYVMERL
jgi:hypothetical protein